MIQKYVKRYKQVRKEACNDVLKRVAFKDQVDCLKIILPVLEPYIPVVENIVRGLPLFELIMIYVEFPQSKALRRVTKMEFTKRTNILNWCTVNMNKNPSEVKFVNSEDWFGTQMSHTLQFFNGNGFSTNEDMKKVVQYQRNNFGLDVPTANIIMDNMHMYYRSTGIEADNEILYYCLSLPPMDEIFVKYISDSRDIPHLVKNNQQIECILMFTSLDDPEEETITFIHNLMKVQTDPIPIAGACSVTAMYPNHWSGSPVVNYFVFLQDKESSSNFFAASIIIQGSAQFKSKVSEFKASLTRHSQEFLFAFMCCGKSNIPFERQTVKTEFDCPIFQMEVNGELGNNCYANYKKPPVHEPAQKKRRTRGPHSVNLIHGYTTVLMYISWGNPK